ncbi:MAG: hypothetical protein HY870_19630 [Chloroflexi bacterium]|nr:hypothetical protein [Chloroflexota bacterium]
MNDVNLNAVPVTSDHVHQLYAELERRVTERTAELTHINQQLAQEIVERARAKQALSWEAAINGIMAEIAQSLLRSASMAETAALVIRSAQELTRSVHGFIGYVDSATGYFTCPIEVQPVWESFRVASGLNAFQLPSTARQLWPREPQPVIINHTVDTLAFKRVMLAPAVFSSALAGLIVLADADHDYTEREADFIRRLSTLYALAIQRQRTEAALQTSEERFRRLFENAPVCLLEVDVATAAPLIVRANDLVQPVFGWRPQTLAQTPFDQLLLGGVLPELQQRLTQTRPGEAFTIETIGVRHDRSAFPIRLSLIADRAIVAIEDLTIEKQRRSEEEAIAEERRRIARDMHDGLAQDLAALRVRSALWHDLIESDPARLHAEIDALQDLLRQNIQDVRRSIFALRPAALDELGFSQALRQFALDFGEQNRLHIELHFTGSLDRLRSDLEPALFRIVQEALNNVGKHARARQVSVELNLPESGDLTLTVQDDGRGFEPTALAEAVSRGRVGLLQMRERAERLGGTLDVSSQPERGTLIRVTLPVVRALRE